MFVETRDDRIIGPSMPLLSPVHIIGTGRAHWIMFVSLVHPQPTEYDCPVPEWNGEDRCLCADDAEPCRRVPVSRTG